jgi:hypothetical protein
MKHDAYFMRRIEHDSPHEISMLSGAFSRILKGISFTLCGE